MELEIGLKITQTTDDKISTADLRVAKDKADIVFLSRETESSFILWAHLKGYRREDIEIAINEDGSQIAIDGNKPVQEKLIRGWILHKREVEIKGFRKVFLIPKGVVLDKIKARFEEDTCNLTVFMPKLVEGLSGHKIEEIKETDDGSKSETLAGAAGVTDAGHEQHQKDHHLAGKTKDRDQLEEAVEKEMNRSNLQKQIVCDEKQAPQADGDVSKDTKPTRKRWNKCKLCDPAAIAGSALLVSLLIIVVQLIRTKQK